MNQRKYKTNLYVLNIYNLISIILDINPENNTTS